MVHAARSGESGGRPADSFPFFVFRLLQVALVCALGLAALHARPAHADGLYRCQGARGEVVFSSSKAGYRGCSMVHGLEGASPTATTPPAAPRSPRTPGSQGWHYRQGTASVPPTPATPHRGARVLRGAVYRVVHADGSIEYTNVHPRGGKVTKLFTYIATCIACNVHSTIDWSRVPLNLAAYGGAIRQAASDYGVDAALLRAVIHAESAFNPRALSSKGAQGLMQLMPDTASAMGVDDAFDAGQNIRGGARYLAQLLKDFGGDTRLAAAAYNAGPQAVRRYGGVPPYAETEVYVKRVGILRRRYAAAEASASLADRGGAG